MQANFSVVESLRTVDPRSKETGKFVVTCMFFVKFHTLYIVILWHKRNEPKSVMHM